MPPKKEPSTLIPSSVYEHFKYLLLSTNELPEAKKEAHERALQFVWEKTQKQASSYMYKTYTQASDEDKPQALEDYKRVRNAQAVKP